MPHQSEPNRTTHGEQWLTTLASIIAGAGFLSLWFWLLPRWLGLEAKAVDGEPWRWLAAIPSALGFAAALHCIWDFGWTGRGTPVPVAPPQRRANRRGCICVSRHPFVCSLLRRAHPPRQIRRRLRGVLPKRPPLVAPT